MSRIPDYRTIEPPFGDMLRRMFTLGELRAFVEYLSFLPDDWPIDRETLRVRVPYPHEGVDLQKWANALRTGTVYDGPGSDLTT